VSIATINPKASIQRVWRSRFTRNVALVASGTAGAQAITLAFSPLITRIYGPEAFGLLGTFMAIVAVATPLAALAYPIAIVLPKSDRDALGLVRLSVIVSFGIALLVTGLLVMGGEWLAMSLGADSVAGYMYLIPVAMLFAAWMQVCSQWLIRKSQFGVIARSAVAHSLVVNAAKSGLGWMHPFGGLLIALATLGHLLHAGLLFIGASRRYQPEEINLNTRQRTSLTEIARLYNDFPLYRAPQNFINAASQSLPILVLAAFFSPVTAGFYTLAKMVMGKPIDLIGKAVNDVFYPRITEAANNGENVCRQVVQATGALFAIGIFPFGLVILFGPSLFELVFGDQWGVAGEYARWLAIWLLAAFINRPSVATIPVLSFQRGFLVYEVLSLTARIMALGLGVSLFQDAKVSVALFAVTGLFSNLILIIWVVRASYKRILSRQTLSADTHI
jgi:O-antigen/teichoic acid export membrane protein